MWGWFETQRDFFNKHRDYFKGQVFTAYGYQIFESGAIRHGKFKHFRTDKSAGDCDFSQVPNLYHRKPRRWVDSNESVKAVLKNMVTGIGQPMKY